MSFEIILLFLPSAVPSHFQSGKWKMKGKPGKRGRKTTQVAWYDTWIYFFWIKKLIILQECGEWREKYVFLKLFCSSFFLQEAFWPAICKILNLPDLSLSSVHVYGRNCRRNTWTCVSLRTCNEMGGGSSSISHVSRVHTACRKTQLWLIFILGQLCSSNVCTAYFQL